MDCFNGDHYFNTSRVAKTKTKAVNLQTVSLDIQIHSQFFSSSLLGRSNLLHRSLYFGVGSLFKDNPCQDGKHRAVDKMGFLIKLRSLTASLAQAGLGGVKLIFC